MILKHTLFVSLGHQSGEGHGQIPAPADPDTEGPGLETGAIIHPGPVHRSGATERGIGNVGRKGYLH